MSQPNSSPFDGPAFDDDAAGDLPIDRIDWLVSACVDDTLTESEIRELEALLLESDENRQSYLSGMQLHADLTTHFRGGQAGEGLMSPQVLSFLGPEGSDVALPPVSPSDAN